ncbi:cation diffusion facilitator family transporter [Anaerolinea thermolimosa]|uniref:cation diffusion facilitator family transporter n=1 Tax=Anaerolinea thermolimosa TaxID=229919 RepID=UPI000784B358|nr:cation diffusion facilitator family transporter [Anaerolinea thermolimosa]GAP06007.1 cation diffusion facilitator family transporter [Anaerolinea thermolimosa]
MRWIREITPQPEQNRLYRQALVLTLGGNVFLALMKALVAYISGSVALYSDAANSISDVVYSLFMVFGLWYAQRPPDLSHPQGHSRFEPLIGLMVTVSMAFAGYEAARASIQRFLAGGLAVEPGLPALVLFVSAAVKVGMFYRIRSLSKKLASPTLATTARDNLSDVLTSGAALVGAVGSKWIHPLTDPIGGVLVSLWIFRTVFKAVRENLGFLTGQGADEALRQQLVKVAEGIEGVQRVHHLMSEYTGPRLVVDLHINVDGEMSVHRAHEIADEVIRRLEEFPEVDRVYVHIEPDGVE